MVERRGVNVPGRGPRALERDVQAAIVDLARLRGWDLVYHTFDSRKSVGGFPDLVLARRGRGVVFAEVKRVGEKPRPDQVAWLDELASAGGEVYLWTLDDLEEIGYVLRGAWRFVPFGESVTLGGSVLDGPRLVTAGSGGVSCRPRSSWVPGQGRRDSVSRRVPESEGRP